MNGVRELLHTTLLFCVYNAHIFIVIWLCFVIRDQYYENDLLI